MPRINDNAALTVREIEYSIQIRDKDKSHSELRDVLRSELTRFDDNVRRKRFDTDNPIREFLKTNIERSILIRENTRIYFLGYREKEGSLHIEFNLLVITSYINFGPIRQALDYLVKDTIADYFEELLERHFPVSIAVQANDKEVFTVTDTYPNVKPAEPPKRDMLSRTFAIIAFSLTLCIIGFFAFRAITRNWHQENDTLKEQYLNLLLEKKINEAVANQKFNIIIAAPHDTIKAVTLPSAVQPK
ncbi:MAG: hypothetical protein HXX13_11550 [Bacteroidetes bacterium]|nr:hypothetical protein [Bacteroidota bacterium]